ncbi:MAG: helicase-related protein [Bilophila wadsworthia]
MDALCRVLDSQGFRKALVFCATKRSVDEITVHLQQRGYQADGLHGDMNQTQRDRVMSRFRTDGIEILVATDVAARGIDVDDVDAVINYDIPTMWKAIAPDRAYWPRPRGKAHLRHGARTVQDPRNHPLHQTRIQRAAADPARDVSNIRTSSCWMKSARPWPKALWIAGGYWWRISRPNTSRMATLPAGISPRPCSNC